MMNCKPHVLIVEDEREKLEDYLLNLRSEEYSLIGVHKLEDALVALEQQTFDVIVTDLMLPDNPEEGMQVIEKAKSLDATIAVIVVTGYKDPTSVAKRTIRRLGAQAFFLKPLDFAACRKRIHQAILERRYRLAAIEAANQGGFVSIPSPYMAGKPLGQGNAMFYGRNEIFDFIRDNIGQLSHHNHLALIGPRRIGKTSILQQLPERLSSSFLPVYINCQSLGIDPGIPAFFVQLARQIQGCLAQQSVDVTDLPVLNLTDLEEAPTSAFVYQFLPQLYHAIGERSLVLCLDEFEELASKMQRGRLDGTIFEFLCSLMLDEDKIVCVLAGSHRLAELAEISYSAASIIGMITHCTVGLLSPDLARCLIEEPVAYSGMRYQPDAIEAILSTTGGYPYLIQLLCGLLVNRRNEQRRNEVTAEDVRVSIEALLELPQPGFFWESLTPHQQAVLIVISQLRQQRLASHQVITVRDVKAKLQELGVCYQNWRTPVSRLLQELALEGLLSESAGDGRHLEYRLTFELWSGWVRRHKTLDQIQEEIGYDTNT